MNELEYFVLSTHGKRCDIMRYMQQLRDLDEWIEYHLSHLRSIAAERVAYQKAQARQKQSVNCGGTRGRGCRGRGRGQASAAAAESTLHAHHVHDVDASPQEEGGGNNGDADTVAGAYAAELHRQFAWHETCVQRRCHEREALAAELAERCSEVQLSMASRLANFAAVADVPVTELSG
ncbi:conserved hypothetical protein [Leishmania major strain Friedlin]|uniref:Uncharacterized protein n=1 Tax=Leishmania major TaxID=5664 RepID=Q4Q8I4_LEIMA|nr:conserved hypothetical protein [Leishmania major strain Friedlin]CAG9577188.1 hypothetical_protein_-_conserved [Leishmania major strain Friedlin]CAJ05180.1 conserved hypothetical protein [Leishmania major strain Friedlin]|eukprot:XP_001684364.1 conserved hypothetical protein [Leishmania major strain Friedlin]